MYSREMEVDVLLRDGEMENLMLAAIDSHDTLLYPCVDETIVPTPTVSL